jgi:hypothetical protein
VNIDLLFAISVNLPEVNLRWIINGTGEMLKDLSLEDRVKTLEEELGQLRIEVQALKEIDYAKYEGN